MILSQRLKGGPRAHLAYGAWNEAEDVLASTIGATIGLIDRHAQEKRIKTRRVAGRAARRVAGRNFLLPATQPDPSIGEHDHVFFLAHGAWDLPLLERLRSLRARSVTLSVWMPEIWPADYADDRLNYECYSMVDNIFVGIEEAVEPFARMVPTAKVHLLTPAVDVMRFAPVDPLGDRGIAVLGIGRRDPAQHAELLEWARKRRALYVYDTLEGRAVDWKDHRESIANWYQHSHVAICNFAKHDSGSETGGLRVLPGRLFEGLASGAILVGIPPDEQRQRKVLGDTVVEPLDGSDGQLSELLDRFRDPAEAQRIRVRNLALACRGHDWAHRWRTAFEVIGLPVPINLVDRLELLDKRASEYEEQA